MTKIIIMLLISSFFLLRTLSSKAAGENKTSTVYVLATGGTISATASNCVETTDYDSAQIKIEDLLKTLPELKNICKIRSEQYANLDSSDITLKDLLDLSKHINKLLSDDTIDGLVLTHGTDTMEETAYFLNLTVLSEKPVVVVGAMRPNTAISADGPLNLYNAILVACNSATVGKGVVISINDGIYSARDTRKASTYKVNSFTAAEYGCIGVVQNSIVSYYYESIKKHTTQSCFNVSELEELPVVEIIYEYLGSSSSLLSKVMECCDGIVFAGNGNGNLNKTTLSYIETSNNLPLLVRSSKTMSGPVQDREKYERLGLIAANDLSPQKARILLMLALTKTRSIKEIQKIFDDY